MKISLDYHVNYCSDEFDEDDYESNYTYCVDLSLQDIIEYLFKERYGKYYNPLSWYLEDGAREFVKDIEDSWLRNDIDEYGMLKDLSLREFLKEKYKDEVIEQCITEHMWYLRDMHNLSDYHCLETWCEVE